MQVISKKAYSKGTVVKIEGENKKYKVLCSIDAKWLKLTRKKLYIVNLEKM